MEMINFKQITNNYIDLSCSDKFLNHYNKNNSFSNYIIDKEINADMYNEEIFNSLFINNPTVIDAGANVGLFTLYVLPKSKKIFCIEPTPSHFEVLKDLVGNFDKENKVSFHNIALSNKDGECYFEEIERNTTENKITNRKTNLKLTCSSLFSFFKENNIESIDILKLDIEGGENEIIFNDPLIENVFKKCKNIYIECHPPVDENAMINKICAIGFIHKNGNRSNSHYFLLK